jgi:predicted Zn-dependent protease
MEPGRRTVLLEAQAVGDLVSFLLGAMSRRSADEGLSAFSRKGGGTLLGDKLFDERITVRSDPADPAGPSRAFDGDGLAHKPRTWIDKGVLSALPCDRFWATKHALEAIPSPSQLRIDGTDADLLALLKGMEDGVVITRLWYNRLVDPRTILATGLTRDGVFSVEKGRIVGAVNNFRYNESPLTLFKRVVALGRPERVVAGGGAVMVVPPMVVEGFELSSKSDAV